MMRFSPSLSALAAIAPGVLALPTASGINNGTLSNTTAYKNVGYFVNWAIYGRDFHPRDVPTQNLTHLLYSFADVNPNGTVKLTDSWSDLEKHYANDSWSDAGKNAYGCLKQIYLLKKENCHMKVLLSIGGWTLSVNFPIAASTSANRAEFASTSVALVKDLGLDGIDIDWEYPTNKQEAADYVSLLAELRAQLDAYAAKYSPGYHYQITIASPAGPTHYNLLDFEGMDKYLDAWHLMAYDYSGSFSTKTGHNANLYASKSNPATTDFSTDRAVTDYIAAGIPTDKIVLGLPLYGRYFAGTAGLGQQFTGMGEGSSAIEPGVLFYKDIGSDPAWTTFDKETGASYWYNAATQELVSFDNEEATRVKTEYIKEKGLGGAMFWDTSMDKKGEESLIGLVAGELGELEQSRNQLVYETSQYANVAAGMVGEVFQEQSSTTGLKSFAAEAVKLQSSSSPLSLEESNPGLSKAQTPSGKKSGAQNVTARGSYELICGAVVVLAATLI